MRFLLLLFLFALFLPGCQWFRNDHVVISSHGTEYGERYYSARLIEKLKNVDGTSIKDTAVIKVLKEALTEELIIEGALFSWARAHKIEFSKEQLLEHLRSQVSGDVTLEGSLHEAAPSMNLLRDAVYIQLIRSALRAQLTLKVTTSEPELLKHFEDIRKELERPKIQLRQIVLAEEHEATTLLQSLREKKISFEDAEKKFSVVRGMKKTEDLPWIDINDSSFLASLANASPGLQNRVLQSSMGFHIVNVVQVKKSANQPFAALRPLVESSYKRKRGDELYLQWLRDQVKTGNISVDQSRLMALTAEYQESF